MAANLTLSSATIDATGKTLTATISGGTGTGYALGSSAGIAPHLVGGNAWVFPVASAAVVGSTLTVTVSTPFGSGESVQLDFPSSVTLTDSGANTPTGQTNLAVTNNSTVAVTVILPGTSPGSFELNGLYTGVQFRAGSSFIGGASPDKHVEFVADATEVAAMVLGSGTATVWTDGATAGTTAPTNGTQTWVAKPLTTSPLAAGKHLFLLNFGDYFSGVRLSGGARTLHTVNTAKRTVVASTAGLVGIPASTEVVARGPQAAPFINGVQGQHGAVGTGQFYVGLRLEFSVTATGCELAALNHVSSQWAAEVDGAQPGALITTGTATVTNSGGYFPLALGKTNAAHTLRATNVASGAAQTVYLVRAINGTTLSTAAAISDTTLTVGSTAHLAVGDWLRIDNYERREWRQITAISGTGPYTITLNAALAKVHAIGSQVTSYSAPVGTFAAWVSQDESLKRVTGMGDSNTQGATDYYPGPDGNGNYWAQYDPRTPAPYFATHALAEEFVNLGIQGQTSTQMAARAADIASYGRTADYVLIWAGTNDINSTSTTPATFQTNIQTLVTAAAATLKAGGKIILMPVATPAGTTNAGGLNVSTVATALQAVQAANPTTCVYAANLLDGLVAGDLNGVHYHPSGQQKIATNLSPYIGGATVLICSGFFAA